MQKQDLVFLTSLYPPEDLFLQDLLESAGIPVYKQREGIAPVEGLMIGPLAEVKIFVPREQEEEARQLIKSLLAEDKEPE